MDLLRPSPMRSSRSIHARTTSGAVDSEIQKQWNLFEDGARRMATLPTPTISSVSSSSVPSPLGSAAMLAELNPIPPRPEVVSPAARPMTSSKGAGVGSTHDGGAWPGTASEAGVKAKSSSAPKVGSTFNPFEDFACVTPGCHNGILK